MTVYARRNGQSLPERAALAPGVCVEYVGPADSSGDDSRLVSAGRRVQRPAARACGPRTGPTWCTRCAGPAAWRPCRPPATCGLPVVQTFDQLGVTERRHGLIPAGAGTERIRLEPAIGRTVDAVVASSYDEESDLTRLGIPRRAIRVVPTGIDTGEFTPDGPAHERNGRHRLVTVADLATEQESLEHPAAGDGQDPRRRARRGRRPGPRASCAATCPTAASPSSATPSTCTAGSSSPARSPAPPSPRCCARPTCWSTSTSTSRRRSPRSRRWPAAPPSSPPPTAPTSTPSSTAPPASSSSPCAPPCSRRRSAPCSPTRCSSRRSASPRPTAPAPATPGTASPTRPSPSTTPPSPPNRAEGRRHESHRDGRPGAPSCSPWARISRRSPSRHWQGLSRLTGATYVQGGIYRQLPPDRRLEVPWTGLRRVTLALAAVLAIHGRRQRELAWRHPGSRRR